MTKTDAEYAAENALPCRYNGMIYTRVVRIGKRYDKNGKAKDFVTLLDPCERSIIEAPTERVQLIPPPGAVITCTGCGRKIVMVRMKKSGKFLPVDLVPITYTAKAGGAKKLVTEAGEVVSGEKSYDDGGIGWEPHWATCPAAERFRKEKNA